MNAAGELRLGWSTCTPELGMRVMALIIRVERPQPAKLWP